MKKFYTLSLHTSSVIENFLQKEIMPWKNIVGLNHEESYIFKSATVEK